MTMDSSPMTLALMAGIFCLLAAMLLAGLAVYNLSRSRPAPSASAPARRPEPPTSRSSVGPSLPGGLDAAYDEEEMPTVVMHQATRPSPPPASRAPEMPVGRTRGATIIAFDDDEDDEG